MLFDDFGIIAAQPLAADREAAKAIAFFDARGLQQWQCRAPGTEKYKAGVDLAGAAAVDVLDVDGPARAVTAQAGHTLAVLDLCIGRAGQVAQQLVGQGAEVDVGALEHAGGGDLLVGRAARHHQRHPLVHQGFVFGVLHAGKGMVRLEGLEAFFQVSNALVTFDIAQVRHWADE